MKLFTNLWSSIAAQKINNPIKIWQRLAWRIPYLFKWKKNPFLPVRIDIEPNNNCNFKCNHCQVTHWNKDIVYLQQNSFIKILDQFPSLLYVKLQGMGEPLLNKQFISMLKAGEERGISISFHSNGSLCDREIAEQLASLKNTSIIFSIDGATAETFEKLRPGSKFQQIKENIKCLSIKRGNHQHNSLSLWTVITRKNIHELPQIVELASDLGVSCITFQPFISDWGKEGMKEYADSIKFSLDAEDLDIALIEAKKIAKEKSIDLKVFYYNFLSKKRKCPMPWRTSYIAANGDVVPCAIIEDSDTIKMGNVFEQDFAEIWNSKEYQDFREKHKTHNIPNCCKNCYLDAS